MNYTNTRIFIFSIVIISTLQSCLPSRKFEHAKHPKAPDYSKEEAWVALPWRFDAADCIPQNCTIPDKQDSALVDVFYVYPTAYVFGINWNAKYDSRNLMTRVSNLTESQASAFNACGKVYTPFYRQAILKSFLNKKSGPKALDLAYEDIKASFQYYMKYWNMGRPFIIAGHSQGSNLLTRLIKEEIDNTELQKQLIAAYLIGMPIPETTFKNIPISTKSDQTNCYISWNTFKYGTVLKEKKFFGKGKSVNPLSWKTDTIYMPASANIGGAPTRLDHVDPNICDAQVNRGILWVHKVKKKGYMRLGDSYHLCDFSFFYMNIRTNAIERTNAYLLNHK